MSFLGSLTSKPDGVVQWSVFCFLVHLTVNRDEEFSSNLSLSFCLCNLFVKPVNRTGDSCYDYRTLFLDVQGKSVKYKRQPFNNHRNNTNNDIVKV